MEAVPPGLLVQIHVCHRAAAPPSLTYCTTSPPQLPALCHALSSGSVPRACQHAAIHLMKKKNCFHVSFCSCCTFLTKSLVQVALALFPHLLPASRYPLGIPETALPGVSFHTRAINSPHLPQPITRNLFPQVLLPPHWPLWLNTPFGISDDQALVALLTWPAHLQSVLSPTQACS